MSRSACLALIALLVSCDEPADVMPMADSGPDPCATALPPLETGDASGHADPLGAASGQSRAGRLDAASLPEDRTGLAVWEAGDFVLANDRVALIIEDVGVSDLYDPYGGRPVGIASVRGGALVDAGDYNEILFGFGAYLVETEQVTVLADGSDGMAAVIRATGPLGELEFAGDLLTDVIPGDDLSGLPAAMDYEMAPGADAVEVYMTIGQPGEGAIRVPMLITAFFQRFRMPIWTESEGFTVPSTGVPMVAFIDDTATSYAWLAPGEVLRPLLEVAGVMVFNTGRSAVAGCSYERIHLGTMVIGGPGLGGLQEALASHRGTTLRTVTGVVRNADGSPAPDARVHVRTPDDRHFARVIPAADGTFSVDVPAGDVSFFAHRPGTTLVGPIRIDGSTPTVSLDLGATGTIRVNVTSNPGGEAIPARVQVLPVGGAPAVPGDLGERGLSRGRAHIAFPMGGTVDLVVDPGEHDVVVSRGYEWEIDTSRVTVVAGEVVTFEASLERVVDTMGVMCADFHIHTTRSPDSPDPGDLKIRSLIADGLEIAVRTDHEWIRDFQAQIEAMGLAHLAFGIGGIELTTFAWGHFGVFPLVEDPTQPSGGAFPWVGRLPPAVFADIRARSEDPVLIINHPRSGGVFGGYFNAVGLDNTTGMVANTDLWDEAFTLVEVMNDESFEEARSGPVADWFGFLRSGRRVFAVGSSDSHNVDGSPVGYPRTCLRVGTDNPADLTPNVVRDATARGASTISGGIYLDVTGPGGEQPGDTVSGAGTTASFEVRVQAASWIEGSLSLEVIVDGVTTETIPITEADRDPLNAAIRLHTTGISVPVDASGSWVVFHVSSDGTLDPVHPGRIPFAVSNPVFLTR